jgi:hypothetical protein
MRWSGHQSANPAGVFTLEGHVMRRRFAYFLVAQRLRFTMPG